MRAQTLSRTGTQFITRFAAITMATLLSVCALPAQKTKVGYDKQVDFGQFKTYQWLPPQVPVTRPLLAANIIGAIDRELVNKGLRKAESNPDLLIAVSGGVNAEGGFVAQDPTYAATGGHAPLNSTVWSGPSAPSLAPITGKGMLIVELVDANQKNLVWRGTVKANLDPEKKTKSMERVNNAIAKLFQEFPPKKK